MIYIYKAEVVSITDGDTADIDLDCGFDIHFATRLRFYGINAPELHASDPAVVAKAQQAKAFVQNKIPPGTTIYIQTVKDRQEKYGRYLGTIFLDPALTAPSINQQLVDAGLAVVYFGEGPK